MTTDTNTPQVNPERTIGRASVESQDLAKRLLQAEPGEVVTYIEMNTAAKTDVRARNGILQTARRVLLREHGVVFGTVREVGLKRLANDEIPDEATSYAKRAREAARKGAKVLAAADVSTLSPEARIRAITTRTVFGLFSAAGSRKVRGIAEQHARTAKSDQLQIGSIETLFGK